MNMKFSQTVLWVQVHNVPLVCMTKEIGLFIDRQIGIVCELDLSATGDCLGKFLQIRVSLDISKPLKRCIRMELDGSRKASTMLLCYERLPEFCFYCGILGHATRDCVDVDKHMLANLTNFDYSGWLRASSPLRAKRNDRTANSPVGVASGHNVSIPRETPMAGLKQRPVGTPSSPLDLAAGILSMVRLTLISAYQQRLILISLFHYQQRDVLFLILVLPHKKSYESDL
ncbi:hypothetical protein JRO89_XS07G0170200 [Xanthoceras sorbifolium]|uniref:CCHC-type domain-containing protein n=1 Tax=Xanthoceras sorbifolium TaxID=99658 RepID=A0ABQ8HUB2_9ROSI|nr:hypothetical protein JRO89_XS07G0170200 [Xanthoceras sorbifolium]